MVVGIIKVPDACPEAHMFICTYIYAKALNLLISNIQFIKTVLLMSLCGIPHFNSVTCSVKCNSKNVGRKVPTKVKKKRRLPPFNGGIV